MVNLDALANYGGAAVANPLEYELISELFPSASSAMDDLLEVMANG